MWTRRWCTSVLLIQRSVVWLESRNSQGPRSSFSHTRKSMPLCFLAAQWPHGLVLPSIINICHWKIILFKKPLANALQLPQRCMTPATSMQPQDWNNLIKQRRMGFPNIPRMKPLYHSFPTHVAAWLAHVSISVDVSDHFVFPILSVQVVYSHESAATRLDKSHWTRRMSFPTIPQTMLLYHSFRGRLAGTKELWSLLMSLLQVGLPLHNDPLFESVKPNSI